MLFSVYPHLTQNYFILCFIASLGLLQWVAARRRRLSLSLLGPWGFGWPGMGLGLSAIAGSFIWFFTTTPGLFNPGLAGGELFPLFITGTGTALLVTRLAGTAWQKIGRQGGFERGAEPFNPKSSAKPPGGKIQNPK